MENQASARPRTPWAEFLFTRVLVFALSRSNHGDTPSYFEAASRLVAKGTPYGEDGFGYPALAFLFVSIPWVLGARKFDLYFPFYRAQCFLVDVLLFHLLSRRCSRSSLLVYILSTALLANLLYHRLDLALGLLVAAALALEGRGSSKVASFTLGASAAFKVIPIFLLPAWLLWSSRRSIGDALRALAQVLLGAALPMALAYALWGKDALFFMGTHAERGIQIESIWASLEIALMEFGLSGSAYFAAGSLNLSTPLEGAFTAASHASVLAAALWGGVLAHRLSRRGGSLALAVSSTLGALLLASKVFSPQYLLFFLPALVLSLGSLRPGGRQAAMALTLGTAVLTTWVYPYHEKELGALAGVATVPLILRNALFAALVILLHAEAWRFKGPRRAEEGTGAGDRRAREGG